MRTPAQLFTQGGLLRFVRGQGHRAKNLNCHNAGCESSQHRQVRVHRNRSLILAGARSFAASAIHNTGRHFWRT
jgi:hypothetical protein